MTEQAKPPAPAFICPFCGSATPDQPRCAHCSGPLDPLSRQATQNAMGPWFIRDEQHPFRPGCSYETILAMVARGKITSDTILRGPSTSQFWYPAKRVPGVAHRLVVGGAGGGVCHSCQHAVTTESECPRCGAVFHADPDRQFLGLMPVRALPGSGVPLQEPRQHASPSSNAPGHSAFANTSPKIAAPPARDVSPRSSISSDRLESEIATLRRRTGVLIGVAAGCALVALGAIWVLASGIAQSENAPPTSQTAPAPTVARGVPQASSPPVVSTKPAPEEPAPAEPNSSVQPAPAPVSEPGEKPDSEARPSDELASLRAIRWP